MRKSPFLITSIIAVALQLSSANAESDTMYNSGQMGDPAPTETFSQQSQEPFTAFTGKVTKNKVRMRVLPNLDSPIVKELKQGELLMIIGETEDFYAVQPPQGIKGYVFRTYILDNIVEASRVNVRMEPDLEAPVIAQLHSGDRVQGSISTINNKWMEVAPPETSRFYVSKDYVEKIGDASALSAIEKRRDDVNILLNSTYLASQTEMQKAFPEINLDKIYANFNKVVSDFKDFPEQVARAKELISSIQDSYLQKKVAFLEAKTKIIHEDWQSKNSQLSDQMKSQQQKMAQMEQQLKRNNGSAPYIAQNSKNDAQNSMTTKMSAWVPVEKSLYDDWAKNNNDKAQDDFYREQNDSAVALRGIIEPYNRVIKNKPGDFILVNQTTHLPVAYIYSTQVNLQDRVGQEVTIYGATRDNKNFAFPAYFVLSVE